MTDAERVIKARKALGLTQAELAKRLGLTERTIRNYESGDVSIKRGTLLAIEQIKDTAP